ncbi:hypothetical protein WJX81_000975 [Elliptochloris bilobata]|uniref:Peptidase M28 domain-containing protein n=1 Tax=Elliptochloris bilobata TaxID=381761 RepID=A0AAW1S0P4_9CHLO
MLPLLLIVCVFAATVALSVHAAHWTPEPLGVDAPAEHFSEARAMRTVRRLTDEVGLRRVSTPGVEAAARLMVAEAGALAALTAATRPDLLVQVDREQVSGAVNLVFAGVPLTNAYRNLTNVVLRVAPVSAPDGPAVLVNAHFDSMFGTRGASDCAGCVGVALEAARVLVANPNITLPGPAVFLFNGGEETVLQASHGFMAHSRWARGLGAFINLESTGASGPDVLFQHTGAWTLRRYARAAQHPHGSCLAQDLFESRVISMDTDFRMFSAAQMGSLPGIDLATVLDGAAYHTDADVPERMAPGSLQLRGFITALWALGALASAAAMAAPAPDLAAVATALAACAPALAAAAPLATVLPAFVLEHISIMGGKRPPLGLVLGDAAAGAAVGACLTLAAGTLVPLAAHAARPRGRALVLGLLAASAACAALASQRHAYSPAFPKRVFLQHRNEVGPDGRVSDSRWCIGGLDAVPIERVLPPNAVLVPTSARDWQALHPVARLMQYVSLAAPPPEPGMFARGALAITLAQREYRAANATRLHLVMRLPRPGWGSLNITGDVRGWSFTDKLSQEGPSHMVRFAGNNGSEHWPFWVDMGGLGAARVEAAVMLFQDNAHPLAAFAATMPSWASVDAFTSFHACFDFA